MPIKCWHWLHDIYGGCTEQDPSSGVEQDLQEWRFSDPNQRPATPWSTSEQAQWSQHQPSGHSASMRPSLVPSEMCPDQLGSQDPPSKESLGRTWSCDCECKICSQNTDWQTKGIQSAVSQRESEQVPTGGIAFPAENCDWRLELIAHICASHQNQGYSVD